MNETHDTTTARPGLSRRSLLASAGAAVGAAALVQGFGALPAAAARTAPGIAPAAFDPAIPGAAYLMIDASAFGATVQNANNGRYVDDLSGVGILNPPGDLLAPLVLPAGTLVRQLNVSYYSPSGTLRISLMKRPFGQGVTTIASRVVPNSGSGAQQQSIDVNERIEPTATYYLLAEISSGGQSIFGIGVAHFQGFVPVTPSTRPVDTRTSGGKLAAGEERTVALGLPAGARAAVLNLTLTGTEGDFGYVAVFPANIAYPGNSSMNWFGPNQTTANAVITAVDAQGRVKLRSDVNATHVVIDVVGVIV